ncbi:DUF5597 domain-containing protein [Opitutus sp. ER46]|uniref:GH35 family beta-galactosidase n=1 Tax=Opitutus sp. ER46 TaxID=2161864 RepID=UPI000D325B83|nr:DUF5597 domain-containing protein [Opitutus sp. ER46]PTX91664.1 beta-galactosidase [Opitutus sp. ER46]
MKNLTVLLCLLLAPALAARADTPPPHLRAQGTATQLIVDGHPFLIRGGEINNSSATNPAFLAPTWSRYEAMNLNTLLVPVYWDLIEPEEGRFDFATVDQVLAQAREHRMRLVLLWFGSWKNSMSCYAPAWVKKDVKRFPRAEDLRGDRQEILTPFSEENLKVDARAFAQLMQHLRQVDGTQHTVIMIQVENEIGMIPTARDHCAAANAAFARAVPTELMDYLAANLEHLAAPVKAVWQGAGAKRAGTWTEVFGASAAAEEIFMAWHFARFTDAVAVAGKQAYTLPMFVNAALIRPGHQPGQYPSAGPLPHLFDVWRAAAPSIDFLSPDIYMQGFMDWARRYRQAGNPLFIPEAMRSPEAAVNALYAYGAHDAMGFSPFGIDSVGQPAADTLKASFGLIAQLEPVILAYQGKGAMAGLLSEGPEQRQPQEVTFGSYVLNVTFERGTPPALADGFIVPTGGPTGPIPPSGGLVIAVGPDEFIFAGTSIIVTFATKEPGMTAGILSAEEGRYVDGTWQNVLWLGGDQTHQGRHIRLEPGRFSIQRVKLYRY